MEAFRSCISLGEIKIPEQITCIYESAFVDCENLRTVILPKRMKIIGMTAFAFCLKLNKIKMPETLLQLETGAFARCENLNSITIPDGVAEIFTDTFYKCPLLHFAFISEKVEKIQPDAFSPTTILHFQIKQHLFSIEFYEYEIANAFCQPDESENAEKIILYYLRQNDTENLKHFLECGFITDSRIDNYIQFAIENQKYECQVILMDYKHDHIGYQSKDWEL